MTEGEYIGTPGQSLDYTPLIDNLYGTTTQAGLVQSYFDTFVGGYNTIVSAYGPSLGSLLLSPVYREINQYTIQTGAGTDTIELLGNYKPHYDLSVLSSNFKSVILGEISSTNISTLMGLQNAMSLPLLTKSELLLNSYVSTAVENAIYDMIGMPAMGNIESQRNTLIKTLDGLNFIVETNGFDGKITNGSCTGASLIGYTYDVFYPAYSSIIDFIKSNENTFTQNLDVSYNFNGISMTTDQLCGFLAALLSESDILNVYRNDKLGNFTSSKILGNITKALDKFFAEYFPTSKTVSMGKYPTRKDSNKLTFEVADDSQTLSDDQCQKLIKIKTTKGKQKRRCIKLL